MRKTQLTEEIFKMKFEDIYDRFEQKRLSCEQAAEILGVSVRTFHRKRQRYTSDDFEGWFDLRLGKPSPLAATRQEVEAITQLYATRYQGFNVKHFYSFAKREEGLKRSYSWTKNTLIKAGLVTQGQKTGKHRKRRERRPMRGMMLHQDGSTHRWLPLEYDLDLIATLDDATSDIISLFLVEEEGTHSTFRALQETIEQYGLFCSFYTDRGSHYFYTPQAKGKVDKAHLTQVGRALKQLGIQHIPAYSPEARGRSERLFQTLQGRLPQEFALQGITTVEAANRYLKEVYRPRHNEEFAVKPASPESAYSPWAGPALETLLSIQEERTVQRDNTVHYNGLVLQLPKDPHRHHYVKAVVQVHERVNGYLSVYYGHRCLGDYGPQGQLIEKEVKGAA